MDAKAISRWGKKVFYAYSLAAHPMFAAVAAVAALYFFPVAASGLSLKHELLAGVVLLVAIPFALLYESVAAGQATINLETRGERARFFLPWTAMFLFAAFFFNYFATYPHAALSLSLSLCTLFLHFSNRWGKVSWHTTGLAAILSLLSFYYGALPAAAFLVVLPSVAFARWKLGAHTPIELAVGAAAGALASALALQLFG